MERDDLFDNVKGLLIFWWCWGILSRDFVSDLVKKMVAFSEKLIWKGVQDEPE